MMSKFLIGVISFLLGSMFTLLLAHPSTHSVFAQQPAQQSQPFRETFRPNPFTPLIPPMARNWSEGNTNEAEIQIDGLNSHGDTFKNADIYYGGGTFFLQNATIVGKNNIHLVGAAANTVIFMQIMGFGLAPLKPSRPPFNPNRPVLKVADFKVPLSGDFAVPFSGDKQN